MTTTAWTALVCPPAPEGATGVNASLLKDYSYDYRNRLQDFRTFAGGAVQDTASYVHDAFDRPVEQTERHGAAGSPRTTLMTYLGLSPQVAEETHKDNLGNVTAKKSYAYDAFGHRIGLSHTPYTNNQPGQPERFSYGYDVHGSVSLLLGPNGQARAAYGYRPYGDKDAALTKGDADDTNPFNPFRYTGMRLDSASGSLDMEACRFGPDTTRFLQRDRYLGALAEPSFRTVILIRKRDRKPRVLSPGPGAWSNHGAGRGRRRG